MYLQTTLLNLIEMAESSSKWEENTMGKRRNCSLRAISPFPHSVFKTPVSQTP